MTTTDRAALYRGILERPDDDVARRVFADYLRENGEEARADFIEVQLRLAEIEHDTTGNEWHETGLCSPYCELCPELRRLNDRESHLWGHGFGGMETPDGLQSIAMHIVGESFLRTGIVSRGFVSAVRCTLADWVGGECQRCAGHGDIIGDSTGWTFPCEDCKGEGRTPAYGPRIVAGQPVEEVRTERVASHAGGWHWFANRNETDVVGPMSGLHKLPWNLAELLTGFTNTSDYLGLGHLQRMWHFDSETDANTALSRAIVNWARREAGMPPLREHATA